MAKSGSAKTGVSSGQLCDVSFAGSRITIAGITIVNFMDDANPVEFPDVEVTGYGVNCNGVMIRWAKPNAVIMSVTVIPGSNEDAQLYRLWARYRVQNGQYNSDWSNALTASISVGNTQMLGIRSYSFGGGTMVSGPGGPTATGEGKMQGRTYTFAFTTTEV